MVPEIVTEFNWVDILILTLLLRVIYISVKSGFPAEIFKLLGTISAVYFACHYYTAISDFVIQAMGMKNAPLDFLDFVVFSVLVAVCYLVFVLIRELFSRFIKMEAVSQLNKWGGLILGIGRSFLVAGLAIFMLVISSVDYLKTSANHSYFGQRFVNIAPSTYTWIWDNLMSKFMVGEKFNKTISEVLEKK